MTLEDFETLVLSQKPAEKPWQPVTDYSFEARKVVEGPHAQLLLDVFRPEHILDAGCGPEGHLVRMLHELGFQTCCGFDKQCARRFGSDTVFTPAGITQADLTANVMWLPGAGRWDLVICREVLEHLTIVQLAQAVRNLCALSSRYVYVTTRFHPAPTSLLDVATSDDLDPTHITMLNQDLLRVLFVCEGFKRRKDLERRMDWKNLGRVLVYERAT